MNSFYLKTGTIFLVLVLWAGVSMADTIRVGSSPGNDNDSTDLDNLVEIYNLENDTNLPYPLTLQGKWDDDIDFGFTGSFSGTSGTWSATGWDSTKPLYYSLKGGNYFALFYTNGDTSGDWEIDFTNNGNQTPDLSHISFWTADGEVDPPNPVPEPGTMALLGIGLITIAGYSRKRYSRQHI